MTVGKCSNYSTCHRGPSTVGLRSTFPFSFLLSLSCALHAHRSHMSAMFNQQQSLGLCFGLCCPLSQMSLLFSPLPLKMLLLCGLHHQLITSLVIKLSSLNSEPTFLYSPLRGLGHCTPHFCFGQLLPRRLCQCGELEDTGSSCIPVSITPVILLHASSGISFSQQHRNSSAGFPALSESATSYLLRRWSQLPVPSPWISESQPHGNPSFKLRVHSTSLAVPHPQRSAFSALQRTFSKL